MQNAVLFQLVKKAVGFFDKLKNKRCFAPLVFLSDLFAIEPVLVAIVVEKLCLADFESSLCGALGIELYQLHSIVAEGRHKGDIVSFLHGVVDADIVFVLHLLHAEGIGTVFAGGLRIQGRQNDAAAADDRLPGGKDHVAADGTDVDLGFLHMEGQIAVGHTLPGQKFNGGHAKSFGKGLDQGDVRIAAARFPKLRILRVSLSFVFVLCQSIFPTKR